jgi:hypothetical protein
MIKVAIGRVGGCFKEQRGGEPGRYFSTIAHVIYTIHKFSLYIKKTFTFKQNLYIYA